ncbi:MAG: VWA domain-containing protein [Steroidobacteraceae bacterium]
MTAATGMARTNFHRGVDSECPHFGLTAMAAVVAQRPWWLAAAVLTALAAVFFPGLVRAEVDVRVESRPINDPIEVYVTVTDANGQPVGGLSVSDFTVTLDGSPITFQPSDFSLPPSENPDRRVSVVFAMDFSPSVAGSARIAMQEAVAAFIESMTPGDYAAIVKFNGSQGASVEQPFTLIDGGAGSSMLVSVAMTDYPGSSTNLFDATIVSIEQFSAPSVTLPDGPRAVIVISDGRDNFSAATLNTVIDKAGSDGIPVFTIAVSTATTSGQQVLNSLAARTGGEYIPAPNDAALADAYATMASLLDNGYLLTFQSSISDCNQHEVEVQVTGQATPTSVRFTRCDAVTPPPPPPPNPGGGGGALGLLELFAGLAVLAARRRRRA